MEQAGLLKRTYDPDDRRQIRISLSTQAQALSGEYNRISKTMNDIYYAGFTDDEIVEFENYLWRVLNNLKPPTISRRIPMKKIHSDYQ